MNNKQYLVYKHTSPSGKIYIGITRRMPEERWGHDGIHYKKQNPFFYNAIKKYGWDKFQHEILIQGLSKEEASTQERLYIQFYHSDDSRYGYNLTTGGEQGCQFNDEIKEKISNSTKKQWQDPIVREKMILSLRESHKGKFTQAQREAAQKRRKNKINDKILPHTKKKHIPWNKGKKLTTEQKKKISETTRMGMNNLQVKQKIRDSNKQRTSKIFKNYIAQFDLNNNLIELHKGEANASRATGIHKTAIHQCVSGKTKTAGGYIWKKIPKEKII